MEGFGSILEAARSIWGAVEPGAPGPGTVGKGPKRLIELICLLIRLFNL